MLKCKFINFNVLTFHSTGCGGAGDETTLPNAGSMLSLATNGHPF